MDRAVSVVTMSWHHQLLKITVLEIDLTIDSYLTAFLEWTAILLSECCTEICIDFYIF